MKNSCAFWSHPALLNHGPLGHPEGRSRLEAIFKVFEQGQAEASGSWVRSWDLTQTRSATREELLRVHTPAYVDRVLGMEDLHGETVDLDSETPLTEGSVVAARRAAGLCLGLVEQVVRGELSRGFAVVRPPGHHARPDQGMGFCVFNSIAIAAHQALAMGLERVLILDWDVHHGNGTQEIFYEDARVLFVDLHQEDLFPKYSGRSEEIGTGKGEGFTLNLPLPHSSTQEDYLAVLERVVKPRVFAFRPQLILISAGFDADISDPMGSMSLTWEGYRKMTQTAVAWADELCGGKVLMVLEGGYEPQALARNVYECAQVLAESSRGEDFLASVPDWSDGSQVESWLLETRTRVGQLTREPLPESAVFYMGAPGGEGGASLGPLGGYASERWRKWVLCLYAADLLSYPLARDQVEFDRLAFLVSRFPQGFQLVLVRAGECWLPVGYTGWYPMGPSAFDAFEKNPGALTSRMVVPEQSAYLYLFNFSVAPLFKKTSLSMQMMQNYAQTIRSRNPMGLAAITVSQEGRRVVERFGLSPRGELRTSSSVESVYIWRGGGK